MGALIDSSVLIAAERRKMDLEKLLAERSVDEQFAISAITASELLHGAHRAQKAEHRATREAFIEGVFKMLPILPFDSVAARVHAALWAELAQSGVQIGPHDLLIGATALSVGYGVATRDRRSFPKIPGLSVLEW